MVIPIVLEVPQQEHHGDLSCNVAMKLAGILKKSSLEIAEAIVKVLRNESALKAYFSRLILRRQGLSIFIFPRSGLASE